MPAPPVWSVICSTTVDGAGGCEFMADVAARIPPTIFCWMVGCDVSRGPELAHWSAIALQAFSGDPAVMGDVRDAIRYLRRFAAELLEAKQGEPGDDITTALVAGIEQGLLTHADARSLLTELLSASVDNTTHSMGLMLWLLSEHADQWALVAARRRSRRARGRRVRALRAGDPAREALQRTRGRAPRRRACPRAR